MSVDLTITQKGLFKKTLPLSVILGDRLHYGSYDDSWRLKNGELAEREFIAYLPDAIARGFSVTWNNLEKHSVDMRLLTPTGREEIKEFYAAVSRIMKYWNADLLVEGEKVSLERWTAGSGDYIDFNTRVLHDICQKIEDGEIREYTLFSALWPLTIGKEEAHSFIDDPGAFDSWLSEKQSIDVYYAGPRFYRTENGIIGRYVLSENVRSVFPLKPEVPFGMTDPETGNQLKCDNFLVSFFSFTKDGFIGELNYDSFIRRLPSEKTSRYDQKNCIIEQMDLGELQELVSD